MDVGEMSQSMDLLLNKIVDIFKGERRRAHFT